MAHHHHGVVVSGTFGDGTTLNIGANSGGSSSDDASTRADPASTAPTAPARPTTARAASPARTVCQGGADDRRPTQRTLDHYDDFARHVQRFIALESTVAAGTGNETGECRQKTLDGYDDFVSVVRRLDAIAIERRRRDRIDAPDGVDRRRKRSPPRLREVLAQQELGLPFGMAAKVRPSSSL